MVLGILATANPAAAAEPGPDSIEVVDQTTFVAADGSLSLHLLITAGEQPTNSVEGYEIGVTVHGLLGSEDEVDEPPVQALNRMDPIELPSLLTSGGGHYHLEVPVRSGSPFDGLDRVLLPTPGVYPVSVELRNEDGPLAAIKTHLVRLPQITNAEDQEATGADPGAPLPVALVLNVSTAEGLTLPAVQQLLINHPTTPMTVVLQEGVENQLRSDPELAAAFVAALAGRPVLAVPPIDLDPSALAEIGQPELYARSTRAARANLEELGLTVAEGITLLGAPLTEAGLTDVSDLGFDSILDIEAASFNSGLLSTRDKRIQVIRIDPQLSQILGGGTDGPYRANRILARLTMRALVDDAPVVLGGSALGIDPGPSIDAFLRALNQPGAPQPILLSDAIIEPATRLAERPQQDLRPIAGRLVALQAKLATYESFFSGGGNTPDYYRSQILSGLTRQRNPADRRRTLESLDAQLDDDMAVIELHDGAPLTLAARSAPIPIIMESTAGGPREVLLRFNSDKVVATEGQQIVTIEPGTSSIDVELEARSLGISPLEVTVWTPDGGILLANTRFEIRSTAVPGLGLLVSVGAVGLLGAWWVVDIRRRRGDEDEPPVGPPVGPLTGAHMGG
ncbi:MAG: hypothetical protein ACRBK7_08665 [Acidimicrobiales bacterium]